MKPHIAPLLIAIVAATVASRAQHADYWPWRVTLTPINLTPVLYEPARVRVDSELIPELSPQSGLTEPAPDHPCVLRPEGS
jgi:hypothetical protein